MVIKNRKCTDQRIHRPKVAMTFFIGCESPMEDEARSMVNCSVAPLPLLWAQWFSPKKGEYALAEWTKAEKRWICHLD